MFERVSRYVLRNNDLLALAVFSGFSVGAYHSLGGGQKLPLVRALEGTNEGEESRSGSVTLWLVISSMPVALD